MIMTAEGSIICVLFDYNNDLSLDAKNKQKDFFIFSRVMWCSDHYKIPPRIDLVKTEDQHENNECWDTSCKTSINYTKVQ